MTCQQEKLERLRSVSEVGGHGLRSRGRWSVGGKTGLSDPCFLHSCQPCLPGAKFRCPLVFKEEILFQVIGTLELVGEIKVALAGRRCHGGGGLRGDLHGWGLGFPTT